MTVVCTIAIWTLLCVLVLVVPAVARVVGAAVLILLLATAVAALAEERGVETPPQYRGTWCETNWLNIYRRCKESDSGWVPAPA